MPPAIVASKVERMFGAIAPRYDLTNSVLSFGIHHWWKRKLVRMLPRGERRVLDLCTGTGDLLPPLTRRFTKSVGADFCRPMLARGKARYALKSMSFPLVQADALRLPFADGSFDLVTVAF